MNLSFRHESLCPKGHVVKGVMVANMRINLNSLRGVDEGLMIFKACECNYTPDRPGWRLVDEDSAKVEAARERIRARRKKPPQVDR